MPSFTYPQPPQNVPASVIEPSPEFRGEVKKVIFTLVFFALLYCIVLMLSAALAAGFILVGGVLLYNIHNFYMIILAGGLVGAGGLLFFFTIKFLFARKKAESTGYTEVTEDAYPDLFTFIRAISAETETDFPKHIYLSPEVNAAVFYDSSFWSMIFPVRKNLVIGLGLVNMTNLSELKAVIAHEFGHFSQKSMRAGSYVYHANKVIYNLLFENDGYADALNRFAAVHNIFAFCARITVKLVQAIQWVLRQGYKVVNKQYMRLSRQMEFHADAVAAKAAGSNNMIHALRRIEFGDACYTNVLQHYSHWVPQNQKGENLYRHQRIAASFIAGDFELPLENGLPVLHGADSHYKTYSRIHVSNQWASHPSREQREAALKLLGITAPVVSESAWVLFPDSEVLQQEATAGLYANVQFEATPAELADEVFANKYAEERSANAFPTVYEGYYNDRIITAFDPGAEGALAETIDDITSFFRTHKDLQQRVEATRKDIELLDAIADKKSEIRSFDFDGERYRRADAGVIKVSLQQSEKALEEELVGCDKAVYRHFHTVVVNPAALESGYKDYFSIAEVVKGNLEFCNHLAAIIEKFGACRSIEEARRIDGELREAGNLLKSRVVKSFEALAQIDLSAHYPGPANMDGLSAKQWEFVTPDNRAMEGNFNELTGYVQAFGNWSYSMLFRAQKELLEMQAGMLKAVETLNIKWQVGKAY